MAINEIQLGAAAGDGNGDGLREGGEIINSNFTTPENAASKIVQASSADTTSDKVMLSDYAWRGAQLGDYFTYGGTANAITLTSANLKAGGTLIAGMKFRFKATASNTGATTITVDGGSTISCVTPAGVALPADFIRTSVFTECEYNGANFVVKPPSNEINYGNNFDEFGGTGSSQDIARGSATSTTTARFYLPINSNSSPTSITLTSTFSVLNTSGPLSTGVASATLTAVSSNRLAVIDITVSGATVGENLILRTETATSKIVVNF